MTTPGDEEFAMLHENLEEAGLSPGERPTVRRQFVDVDGGRQISALVWGKGAPDVVLLHGGAQNAHTWDTFAVALGLPAVAVDLPGHGHSAWRDDGDYGVVAMADDVGRAVDTLAPDASTVVGIGLGAPVGLLVADRSGGRVARMVMVDSVAGAQATAPDPEPAPALRSQAAANVAAFTQRQQFASFDEMLERTMAYNPQRSERSLRRGLRHNARQLPDGTWSWRWDPAQLAPRDFGYAALAAALDRFVGPVLIVRGEQSDVVTLDAVEAFRRRHARTRLVTIAGGAHAVQGNRPVELARSIRQFRLSTTEIDRAQ